MQHLKLVPATAFECHERLTQAHLASEGVAALQQHRIQWRDVRGQALIW